jgi:hypothetical protein
MDNTFNKLLQQYHSTFAKHTLHVDLDTENYKAFYLKDPDHGRINSVLILFTPEGIVIAGDHAPTRNGIVSYFKCGLLFFARKQGDQYLGEKFLEKVWDVEQAQDWLRYQITEVEKELKDLLDTSDDGEYAQLIERQEALKNILEGDNNDWISEADFREKLEEIDEDISEGTPGFGYPYRDLANLVAINHRFAELYAKHTTTTPA